MRKWFLSTESALFRYRFRLLNAEAQVKSAYSVLFLHFKLSTYLSYTLFMSAQRAVMEEFDLPYKAVSNVEFEVVTCHLFYWFALDS